MRIKGYLSRTLTQIHTGDTQYHRVDRVFDWYLGYHELPICDFVETYDREWYYSGYLWYPDEDNFYI